MTPLPLFIPALPLRSRRVPAHAGASLQRRARPICSAAPPSPPPDIDQLFSRLRHVNKNLRKKASSELAEVATEPIITRLISLLDQEDVAYRRAAGQALAMTGAPALPAILAELRSTGNPTVRASCAKAIGSLALFFPEMRENFSPDALDALQNVVETADPVSKLATIGCLATIGSDQKNKDEAVARGSQTAFRILLSVCNANADMAAAAAAVGALSQIAQNASPEQKQTIITHLQSLTDSSNPDDQSGFNYTQEMARSHLDQLQGASVPSDK
ncbi:Armadillo-like helical domain containing protein [Gracilaria domingensis]|nr:Armadillo-like helical domain containing protein [Gracilaria domingensis]